MIANCENPNCNVWWVHLAGTNADRHFKWITRYCPNCISRIGLTVVQ